MKIIEQFNDGSYNSIIFNRVIINCSWLMKQG